MKFVQGYLVSKTNKFIPLFCYIGHFPNRVEVKFSVRSRFPRKFDTLNLYHSDVGDNVLYRNLSNIAHHVPEEDLWITSQDRAPAAPSKSSFRVNSLLAGSIFGRGFNTTPAASTDVTCLFSVVYRQSGASPTRCFQLRLGQERPPSSDRRVWRKATWAVSSKIAPFACWPRKHRLSDIPESGTMSYIETIQLTCKLLHCTIQALILDMP
jgi:hypothetical protein